MIKAHGGTRNFVTAQKGEAVMLSGIVTKTTRNEPKDVHMKGLDRLITQTTGVPRGEATLEGVITKTTPHEPITPELVKVSEKTHTPRKMGVGATYAGKVSGYGKKK